MNSALVIASLEHQAAKSSLGTSHNNPRGDGAIWKSAYATRVSCLPDRAMRATLEGPLTEINASRRFATSFAQPQDHSGNRAP